MGPELIDRLTDKPIIAPITETPFVWMEGTRLIKGYTQEQDYNLVKGDARYKKPVVVLINEQAQSMPESVLIFLKNSGVFTFVGTATTGTTGSTTGINLPAGGTFAFTGQRVKFSDGSRFQNIGILPDVKAEPTIERILQGRDEILEQGVVGALDSGASRRNSTKETIGNEFEANKFVETRQRATEKGVVFSGDSGATA